MRVIRRSASWLAAFIAATTALACHEEPTRAASAASTLPSREAVHTELHRRQLVTQLEEIGARVDEADALPTLCRLPQGRATTDARALVVTQRMLQTLTRPTGTSAEIPEHDAQLNAAAFSLLADAADGFGERGWVKVNAAIDRITDHRYLAIVRVGSHRAPTRRGDRTVSPGRLKGEVILVDTEERAALCRGDVEATTSSSMNAYGDLDEAAFARDLGTNFLRAVETQISRATGGMKLAWDDDVSRRLASHEASSPSASPP
jgi:hypothetical protein